MLDVKKTLTKICDALSVDYVVDEGTSNNWNYRKWNSGRAECWRTYAGNIAVTTSSGVYGGYRSGEINAGSFPFTFTDTPVTVGSTGTGSQGAWVNNVRPSTTGCTFYLSAGSSLSSASRSVHIIAIGKWK